MNEMVGRLFKLPSTEFILVTDVIENHIHYVAINNMVVGVKSWTTNVDFIQFLMDEHYEMAPITCSFDVTQ